MIISSKFVDEESFNAFQTTINTIIQCLYFLWMLLGAVWIYDDYENCRDEFYEGWMVTVIILIVYFGIIATILLGLCCVICVTCVGSWHIAAFMENDEEENN